MISGHGTFWYKIKPFESFGHFFPLYEIILFHVVLFSLILRIRRSFTIHSLNMGATRERKRHGNSMILPSSLPILPRLEKKEHNIRKDENVTSSSEDKQVHDV